MTLPHYLLLTLIVCVGLVSGLLFAFSIAVSPGLKHLSDIEFIKAIKAINQKIQNSLFFACFFSPLILFPVLIFTEQSLILNTWLLKVGFALYLLPFVITATVNVPLNNQLDRFDIHQATDREITEMRVRFENRWTLWNNVRTVLCTASLICLILFLFNI